MNATTTRRFPPIVRISTTILILVIASGIYVASNLPKSVSLTPSVVLVSIAGLLVLVNMVLLSRIENFAWTTFFLVAKWSFLAYLVIAGMLEFVFIKDGTRGSVLVLLSSTLAIFAINLPILFGFTVAQYHEN
jgi:hypothetical protein